MNDEEQKQASFVKKHGDTAAIIGVQIAFMALLIGMWLSHASRLDAVNARMDSTMMQIQQESKSFHDEMKHFHGRLCTLEERNKGK